MDPGRNDVQDGKRALPGRFYAAAGLDRQGMLDPRPDLTGIALTDALVGAMGEHLAERWDLTPPTWVEEPERFLRTPWFATRLRGLHPLLTVESPLAFRRRMLFVEREPLNRARMHEPLSPAAVGM